MHRYHQIVIIKLFTLALILILYSFIPRNYIPNKYVTIDDEDPVWMNETIKSKIKAKNAFYKKI